MSAHTFRMHRSLISSLHEAASRWRAAHTMQSKFGEALTAVGFLRHDEQPLASLLLANRYERRGILAGVWVVVLLVSLVVVKLEVEIQDRECAGLLHVTKRSFLAKHQTLIRPK